MTFGIFYVRGKSRGNQVREICAMPGCSALRSVAAADESSATRSANAAGRLLRCVGSMR